MYIFCWNFSWSRGHTILAITLPKILIGGPSTTHFEGNFKGYKIDWKLKMVKIDTLSRGYPLKLCQMGYSSGVEQSAAVTNKSGYLKECDSKHKKPPWHFTVGRHCLIFIFSNVAGIIRANLFVHLHLK